MAIEDDISIDRQTGNIREVAGTAMYSVEDFFRYLENLGDDLQSSGDDEYALYDVDVVTFKTVKNITLNSPYNIDDTLARRFYGGQITQDSGDTVYRGLDVVGTVVAGTNPQVIQDNALLTNYWTTGKAPDATKNIIHRMLVKVRADGVDIDGTVVRVHAREFNDTYSDFTVTMSEDVNVAALETVDDINNNTASGTVAGWSSISNVEGLNLIDINNDTTNEEYYSQWNIGSQSINDTFEYGKYIQRRGSGETIHGMNGELFRGITHSFAYDGESGTGPATNDSIAWGLKLDYDNESGTFQVGEAVYIGGSNAKRGRILALDDNGTTGSMVLYMEAGSPGDNDQIVGQTSAATADINLAPVGQATGGGVATLLAVDDDGTTGNLYVQLIKGSAPADNAICYNTTDATRTITVNGSVTARTINKNCFLGVSTGTNIIGAYGIGFETADVGASDKFEDLSGASITPPNNVTFTVKNLVSGDSVLVGPEDGASGLDLDQLALNTTLSGASETSVVVTTTIPSDTPATGEILVENNNGDYIQCTYTSYSGSTFTINAKDFSTVNATAPKNVWIGYIYKTAGATSENFTTVFNSPRTLFVRVRRSGASAIQSFKTTATLGSGGGEATVVRNTTV